MTKEHALRLRTIGLVLLLIGIFAVCGAAGFIAYIGAQPTSPEGIPDVSSFVITTPFALGLVVAPLGILLGLLLIAIASIDIAACKKEPALLQADERDPAPKAAYNFLRILQSLAVAGVVGLVFSYISIILLTDRSSGGMGIGWAVYLMIEWLVTILACLLGGVITVSRKNDLSANAQAAFLWGMLASLGFSLFWGLAFYRP
jgi:hypothetical protein